MAVENIVQCRNTHKDINQKTNIYIDKIKMILRQHLLYQYTCKTVDNVTSQINLVEDKFNTEVEHYEQLFNV